jgi:hypothetical protein
MLSTDAPEQTTDDGVRGANEGVGGAKPDCVALVPMAAPVPHSNTLARLSRPDPSFLTQLIATAERVPQTRNHRRAAPADALSAYRAHQPVVQSTGIRTRQII